MNIKILILNHLNTLLIGKQVWKGKKAYTLKEVIDIESSIDWGYYEDASAGEVQLVVKLERTDIHKETTGKSGEVITAVETVDMGISTELGDILTIWE